MGTVGVVVLNVRLEQAIEVPTAEHECPVKEFPANTTHPALGERVCTRSPNRRENDLNVLGREHLIE